MSSSLKHSYQWIVRNSEVFAWKSLCPTLTKNPGKISAFLYTYFLEIVRRQIKNPFLTKVAQCSGNEKRYIQHNHRTNTGLCNQKKLKKKAKTSS